MQYLLIRECGKPSFPCNVRYRFHAIYREDAFIFIIEE